MLRARIEKQLIESGMPVETAKYSLELHDYMKDIADYMERYLKDKSLDIF